MKYFYYSFLEGGTGTWGGEVGFAGDINWAGGGVGCEGGGVGCEGGGVGVTAGCDPGRRNENIDGGGAYFFSYGFGSSFLGSSGMTSYLFS